MHLIIFINLFLIIAKLFSYEQYRYESFYSNFSQNFSEKCGVAVIAYNRPEYLTECILSIEKNPESQTLPFFFFLDGDQDLEQNMNFEIISKSLIANKYIILRPTNFGIIKNNVDAKRFLFDWCNFEKVISIEEDVVLTSDYFDKLIKLDNWAQSKYQNIATVQLWSYCSLNQTAKKNQIQKVRQTIPAWSFVTYCMGKKAWNAIAPYLYEYEKLFVDPLLNKSEFQLARSKPQNGPFVKKIEGWKKNMIYRIKKDRFDPDSVLPIYNKSQIRAFIKETFNQDCLMMMLFYLKGYTRLQTIVNHAKHIGQKGFLGEKNDEDFNYQLCEIPLDSDDFILIHK